MWGVIQSMLMGMPGWPGIRNNIVARLFPAPAAATILYPPPKPPRLLAVLLVALEANPTDQSQFLFGFHSCSFNSFYCGF